MQLTAGLRKAAAFRADDIALVTPERSFSHGEVLDRVARFASVFRRFGIEGGERVAILARKADDGPNATISRLDPVTAAHIHCRIGHDQLRRRHNLLAPSLPEL